MTSDPTADRRPASQTLSRGLRILELLAEEPGPLSVDEIAGRLGVHRSIAYRLTRTLEDHRLLVRGAAGRLALGPRMAALAAAVTPDLPAAALPELTAVADDLAMTCFLAVLDGADCVTLTSAAPRLAAGSVVYRPGARHPVTAGAPGRAILAQLDPARWAEGTSPLLRADVAEVAARGYATSHDEVIPSVRSVAVPLDTAGSGPAALAVVHVAPSLPDAVVAARLTRAATAIRLALGG